MTDIILTVESGSDIPQELAQRYGIYVVPMHITFGDDTKDDGAFPVTDICDYYSATGKRPMTLSQCLIRSTGNIRTNSSSILPIPR